MSTFKLLRAEILHRKANFVLSLAVLTAAATLFVVAPLLMNGYSQESKQRIALKQEETERQLSDLRAANADALLDMQRETADKIDQLNAETDAGLDRIEKKATDDLAELDQRTKRIMRDLGFNLRIVHQNTDLARLYANFDAYDMPEEYVDQLANSPEITKIVHLVATLKKMIDWEGQPRKLVGFAPEATQSHLEKKPPMGFQIKPGTVYLGSIAAKGHELNDEVEILGKKFIVTRILPPKGNDEDLLLAMHLQDAQEVLQKKGKITEILALGCKCKTVERIEEIRAQLELALPMTQVTELSVKAIARDQQRKLVTAHKKQSIADYKEERNTIVETAKQQREEIVDREVQRQKEMLEREESRHGEIIREEELRQQRVLDLLSVVNAISPVVILVCGIWVGFLSWSNVRERRSEIGLLRAIGKGSVNVASLFLGRAMLVGLLGGVLGCALGYLGCKTIGRLHAWRISGQLHTSRAALVAHDRWRNRRRSGCFGIGELSPYACRHFTGSSCRTDGWLI